MFLRCVINLSFCNLVVCFFVEVLQVSSIWPVFCLSFIECALVPTSFLLLVLICFCGHAGETSVAESGAVLVWYVDSWVGDMSCRQHAMTLENDYFFRLVRCIFDVVHCGIA